MVNSKNTTVVAVVFWRLGPYHHARLNAAGRILTIVGVEACGMENTYAWDRIDGAENFDRVTLTDEFIPTRSWRKKLRSRMFNELDRIRPEVLIVPGWGSTDAIAGIDWAIQRKIPVICMSESTAWDERRNPIKEWIKRRILSIFTAALVGGTPHRAYMEQLGIPADRVFLGYDAVDNDYFERGSILARSRESDLRGSLNLPRSYFLASARFVPKKNLHRLLEAYTAYRLESRDQNPNFQPWDLILLGDGPLRKELESLRLDLGIAEFAHMPGFKQYADLPAYYGNAGAFVHASTTEQWGLVVNEAMASGLPVLVSKKCGCSEDLVSNGVNGWTFDPSDTDELAELMTQVSSSEERRREMGKHSLSIIKAWGPAHFATGLSMAIDATIANPVKTDPMLLKLILKLLLLL